MLRVLDLLLNRRDSGEPPHDRAPEEGGLQKPAEKYSQPENRSGFNSPPVTLPTPRVIDPSGERNVLIAIDDFRGYVAAQFETLLFEIDKLRSEIGALRGVTSTSKSSIGDDSVPATTSAAEPIKPEKERVTTESFLAEYCRGKHTSSDSLAAFAATNGLRWGSGYNPGGSNSLVAKFDSPENAILFMQAESNSTRYFLFLRAGARWQMDYALVFLPELPGGAAADGQPEGQCVTREAAQGTLLPTGTEIAIQAIGRVEIGN